MAFASSGFVQATHVLASTAPGPVDHVSPGHCVHAASPADEYVLVGHLAHEMLGLVPVWL